MTTDRVKLLKFITVFEVGGTERQFVTLGQSLDPSIFDLRLACFRRQGYFLKEIQSLQIPINVYSTGKLYHPKSFEEQVKLARYLKLHRIQILHTYSFYPNVFAIPAARWAGVPAIVASIRDTGAYLTPMKKRVQRLVCRMADRVVVNAEAVKEWLVSDGYDRNKITVIRNGIELSRFSPRGRSAEVRRDLGISADAPVVAVLSRLSDVKGIDYFLEAAAIVGREVPAARFLIVGDAGDEEDRLYKRKLQAYAAQLGLGSRAIFTGMRLDIPEILSTVTVSVLSSLSEGLSNAALEAMASGIPVVATRIGGNPEAVEDGVTGFLVPARDSAALAGAVCRILKDPQLARCLGRAGKERISRHFSLNRMVRETEDLYLDLLGQPDDRRLRRSAESPAANAC